MKLEHLLQAYKINNIDTEIKDMSDNKERTGIITFADGISASYLLDDEDIVIAIKIFFNCLAKNDFKVMSQINHVIKIINIMQKTITLLSNVTQKEANMILESLGLFDDTFTEGKQIKHLEHTYRVEVMEGLLCLSINEMTEER